MKNIIMNCQCFQTKEEFHQFVKGKFQFPDYYGENLDALWDLLASYSEPTKLIVKNQYALINHFQDYGESILEIFKEIELENPNIQIIYQ